MSNASSEYTNAKSTQPGSTVLYTAPEPSISASEGSPSLTSRRDSNGKAPSGAIIDEHRFQTGSLRSNVGTPSEVARNRRSSTSSTKHLRSLERLRDEENLDPRSKAAEDTHRFNSAQGMNKHSVPMHQYGEGMDRIFSDTKHISKTHLRPERERVKTFAMHASHLQEYVERSPMQISPDASRSAALAKRVKQQDVPPQTNAKKNFYVRRTLCVTRIETPKIGESEWRLCTYEELTWTEMMNQLNEERIEEGFRERFGWRMPRDCTVLASEMHKDPMFFKRKYLGWTPDAVSWKHEVGPDGSRFEDLTTTRISHGEQLSLLSRERDLESILG